MMIRAGHLKVKGTTRNLPGSGPELSSHVRLDHGAAAAQSLTPGALGRAGEAARLPICHWVGPHTPTPETLLYTVTCRDHDPDRHRQSELPVHARQRPGPAQRPHTAVFATATTMIGLCCPMDRKGPAADPLDNADGQTLASQRLAQAWAMVRTRGPVSKAATQRMPSPCRLTPCRGSPTAADPEVPDALMPQSWRTA